MAAPPPFPGGNGWAPRFGWDASDGDSPARPPFPGMGFAAPAPGIPYCPYPFTGVYAWPQNHAYVAANHPVNRHPQPHPQVSPDAPGANMINSTGGVGCEPGYNYLFHDEHVKVHVIKTSDPPWRSVRRNVEFGKYHVPMNTTLAELLMRFGATNPDPRNNRVTEVIEAGGGKWYRGMIFSGDDEEAMKKTLKELGWDGTRLGQGIGDGAVWLWITKD
ncbi:hypothetical protein GGR50DRAFT_98270 [Xylaria sp. CBS 124048]|nr:hypothetical protein GGR50DRAFT_98270 [Xylaria sp. CBS 124048]